MKKLILFALIPAVMFACKKDAEKKADEAALVKKYAKYGHAVYEDQEMKKWMATLSKAEGVEFDPAKIIIQPKGEDIAIVKLSDGKTGYVQMKHLADKPVIFIEDTRAHERNNPASRVFATIPKGSIGFIVDEKSDWAQIFVGKVGDKWITQQWVKGGYSTDENLLIDAKIFEEAISVLGNPKAKDSETKDAKKKLEDLSRVNNLFSELASKKLEELMNKTAEEPAGDFSGPAPGDSKEQIKQ